MTTSKIALALVFVLATASGALAAPKHAVHHQRTAVHSTAYGSFGSARVGGSEAAYIRIQDQDYRIQVGG
jgi:hypothetical protein